MFSILGSSCGKLGEPHAPGKCEGLPGQSPSAGNGSVVVLSLLSTFWHSETQPEVSPYSLADERQQKGAAHHSLEHQPLVEGVHIGGKAREAEVDMLNSNDPEVGREEGMLNSGKSSVEVWQLEQCNEEAVELIQVDLLRM